MRVLRVVSSPRGERSASIAVAEAFFDELRSRVPDVEVDVLDVWTEDLPEFDQHASTAEFKATRGQELDEAEAAVWDRIRALAGRFAASDRIVIGVPMWNWAYIEFWLRLIGVREVRTLVVEHTWDGLAGPAVEWGRAQARAMADAF